MMRQIVASNTLFKITRRCMCSNDAGSNEVNKNDLKQMSKHMLNFLNESPLKGYNDKNDWATTPFPVGTTLKSQEKDGSKGMDPGKTSIIMFPGQGNQYVGMGKTLMEHSVVKDMFDAASNILGYDLKKLCLNGPENKLNDTEYCQPATLVCSLAAIEELKFTFPSAISNCVAACGFSVGEIAALVFAGCISFEDAVALTRTRAKEMKKCSRVVHSGMMTVLYGADSDLKGAMKDAKQACTSQGITNPVCAVANYLFPECKVLAGHDVALKYIQDNQSKYKIRKVSRLLVSGAFHTVLMEEASLPVAKYLEQIKINEPLVPVFSNVTGAPYADTKDILKKIPKQIYMPVKWEQILHYVYSRPAGTAFPHTYECGPGNSLSVILRRTNFLASKHCHVIKA